MTINGTEVPGMLTDRGIGWHAVGFAIAGAASISVLTIYSESSHWSYQVFEVTVTKHSWAFVIGIASIIERIRQMFETKAAIRAAAVRKAVEKATEEGLEQGLEQGREQGLERGRREKAEQVMSELEGLGIELPPEAIDRIRNGHGSDQR